MPPSNKSTSKVAKASTAAKREALMARARTLGSLSRSAAGIARKLDRGAGFHPRSR